MRNKADLVFNIVLTIIFLTLLAVALSYGKEARMVPLVVLIPGLVLTGFRIAINLRAKEEQSKTDNASSDNTRINRKFLIMSLWVVALIVMIWLLGFYVGTAVYTFLFLVIHKEKLLLSGSVALGTFAGLYIVFNVLSKIVLYKGQLFLFLAKQGIYFPF